MMRHISCRCVIKKSTRWAYKLTHIPTGIEVIRTSDFFCHQDLAKESAVRYLRSRLNVIGPKSWDVKEELIRLEDEK